VLLTIRTSYQPATDLGFLLHKNPARLQSFSQSFGQAHVFYPEASNEACTAALLLDVDPVALVRGRRVVGESGTLQQYVNDRPYVASSFLSVAISDVFGTAMTGRSKERPSLAETPIPVEVSIGAVPCKGGEPFLRRIFEPLGYTLDVIAHPLDEREPKPDNYRYFTVRLSATRRVAEVLTHVYVLLPVFDDRKHYWVGPDEVDKLLRHGEGWLSAHPERETIARRYLRYRRTLVDDAIERLRSEEEASSDEETEVDERGEEQLERPLSLNEQRLAAVLAALKGSGATRVLDLGCGEGRLLSLLLDERQFTEIVGMDVAYRALETAQDRLHLDRMAPKQRERIQLIHGSLMYRDARLTGYDAAAVVEVIEHLDAPRLAAFERAMFAFAKPRAVVITTPNAEYNVKWETLPAGRYRHRDHRFEWTRAQFRAWAERLATDHRYSVRFVPVGPEDPVVGAPSQMGIFTRLGEP
jgi:3' terminal RNA ribose 2'-O-methyltransferase Hen1